MTPGQDSYYQAIHIMSSGVECDLSLLYNNRCLIVGRGVSWIFLRPGKGYISGFCDMQMIGGGIAGSANRRNG